MSTDSHHKGQLQVVEGSATGDFYVQTLTDYGPCGSLIYLGEAKTNSQPQENRFFIHKFEYDSSYNMARILIAQNTSSLGCTDFTYKSLNQDIVLITLNNGDCSELNVGDSFTYDFLHGEVFKKISDSIFQIKLMNPVTYAETNLVINEFDLLVRFESDKTKDYTKRRWDHRNRYGYA